MCLCRRDVPRLKLWIQREAEFFVNHEVGDGIDFEIAFKQALRDDVTLSAMHQALQHFVRFHSDNLWRFLVELTKVTKNPLLHTESLFLYDRAEVHQRRQQKREIRRQHAANARWADQVLGGVQRLDVHHIDLTDE